MTDAISTWLVNQRDSRPLPDASGHHVMAWARDSATGEPVYVLELDKTRRGAKCGCECPSCNLPLQAVNAAKAEYKKRPHFRHPEGAPKSECLYLSARLAAIQLLRHSGVIQLPRRIMRGQVVGLSGVVHEAWVERPAQTLVIRDFNFRDHAAAILTLEDGRELRVLLVGSGPTADVLAADGNQLPTIWLDLPDVSLASMSPEDLRSRLTLVPDSLCWLSHWEDKDLLAEAQAEACEIAEEFLDLADEDAQELAGIEQKFRRETLLHLEVKRILAESKELTVPALNARVDDFAQNGFGIELEWTRPVETLVLVEVHLERKLGRVIPDVVAQVAEDRGGFMMIEVTVTNQIDADRMTRIRERGIPALEIDLSITGGLVSRTELKALVVYGLEGKKWLHHPELNSQTNRLTAEVKAAIFKIEEEALEEEKHRERVLKIRLEEIADDYLDWIFRYAEFDGEETHSDEQKEKMTICRRHIDERANDLAIHGYSGAGTPELYHSRQGIIPRVLSIKIGRGVGSKLESTMAVMNAIRQSEGQNRSNHSIYLIAEKIYRSELESVAAWYPGWVSEVRASIESNDLHFIRDGKYDRLLSMLFPELARALATGFGTRSWRQKKYLTGKKPNSSSMATSLNSRLLDTRRGEGWLTGRDLENWKRSNPVAAQVYMDSFKPKK